MDENGENYRLFQLKSKEFTFDVDVSNLPCGLNGALYMVAMDSDGEFSEYSTNKCGAKYGTGYCDTQCPHEIKFIDGQANSLNWTGTDANSGTGHYGSCCIEMDIWEANSISAALTPHVCSVQGQVRCEGINCGDTASSERYDGICDKDECDLNSYRMGDTTFYGPDLTVDTSKVITVVTQLITSDNTSTGELFEIRRLYVQDGIVIQNSVSTNLPNEYNSITDDFCNAQKTAFGYTNTFEPLGGLAAMGDALETGLVLVMSLWDDSTVSMLSLDSDYPATGNVSTPGVAR